jgi:phosphatidylserine/phosphatidylglycerophosphate/cardiolipin synthase-like enzyme
MSGSAATVIYLPCDVVSVRARVSVGEGLSPIEKIALRALDARPCTGPQLSKLLGLGDRLTVGVLHGLWRHGYLRIDHGSRKMDVSDEIKRRIADGGLGLDTLPGIDSEVIERELMIEKLTGHVLPSIGHPKAPPLPRLAVDHARADITLDGASRSAIADALNHTIAIALRRLEARPEDAEGPAADPTTSRAGIGLTRRVRSILTTPRELRGATGRRWLAVEVLPTLNQDTGRLIVTVTDRRFPVDRRDLASQLLTQLAADYPADGFVAELSNAAAPALKDPPPLRDTIARLQRSAAGTAGIPAGQRRARHRELFELAQEAEGSLASRVSAEVTADLVTGDQHLRRIEELIDGAQQQLVLVSPRVSDNVIIRLEDRLRRKIRAGVRVILLWGRNYDETLGGRAANILYDLCRERDGGVAMLLPRISARTEARLVIADDQAALVTSHNVLSTSSGDTVGVLVRSVGGGGSQAVRDLLERVRMIVPDGQMSRQLKANAADFSGGDGARAITFPSGPPPSAPRRVLPEPPPDDSGDDPQLADAVAAWTAAWTSYARGLARELGTSNAAVAVPAADGDHYELLWRALRTAARCVVIASHQLGPEVCNEAFRQAVSLCAERGVSVLIRFQEAPGQPGEAAAAGLARLAAVHPERIAVHRSRTDSSVLVCDDEVVVGNFDYLHSGSHTLGSSYQQRCSQLSLWVTGAEIAGQIAAAIGRPDRARAPVAGTGPVPAATGTSGSRPAEPDSDPAAADEPDSAVSRAAQRIRNRTMAGAAFNTVLREEMDSARDPWAVLEALAATSTTRGAENAAQSAAEDHVLTAAVAHCLVKHEEQASPASLERWQAQLILTCWCAGRFTEAAVLRCQYGGEALRPRRWLAVLTALYDAGDCELGLIAAADIELIADERPALLTLAVAELLAGSEYAESLLSARVAETTDLWGSLGQAALEYWQHSPGVPPGEILSLAAAPELRESKRADAWTALERALDRGGGTHVPVNNAPGRKAHVELFGPSVVFGQVAAATPQRNIEAIAAALEGAGIASVPRASARDLMKAAGSLVDQAYAKTAPAATLLEGTRRSRYLDRLTAILSTAQGVVDLGAAEATLSPAPDDDARALARRLADRYEDARRDAALLTGPERRLVQVVLSRLAAQIRPTVAAESS